jgi:hypothetical protein
MKMSSDWYDFKNKLDKHYPSGKPTQLSMELAEEEDEPDSGKGL